MGQLLSFSAGLTITIDDVDLSDPVPIPVEANGANTSIDIIRLPGSKNIKPGGPQRVTRKYRRVDINHFCKDLHAATSNTFGSIYPSVANFNKYFETLLDPNDLKFKVEYNDDRTERLVTATVRSGHYGFFGEVTFTHSADNPGKIKLSDAFGKDEELPGFTGAVYKKALNQTFFPGMTDTGK